MRARLAAAMVFLGVATFATRAHADATSAPAAGTLAKIARQHILRVGMFAGLTPFVAVADDAMELARLAPESAPQHAVDGRAVAGFDVDLAAAAAHALDARLEIVLVPQFDDLLPGLMRGQYDVVMSGLTRTLDRARQVAFSDPYFASGLQVLEPASSRFATLAALNAAHARVVARAGTTAESFARAALTGAALRLLPTDGAVLAAVDRGDADAAVIDYVTARDASVRGRVHTRLVAIEDRRFTVEHFAFAVRQGDGDWLGWLNLMLRETKSSGQFHALAARYNPWFRSER